MTEKEKPLVEEGLDKKRSQDLYYYAGLDADPVAVKVGGTDTVAVKVRGTDPVAVELDAVDTGAGGVTGTDPVAVELDAVDADDPGTVGHKCFTQPCTVVCTEL